ncbi:MAG: hypothetical protein V3U98_06895 [Acidobacteriota bacterium]
MGTPRGPRGAGAHRRPFGGWLWPVLVSASALGLVSLAWSGPAGAQRQAPQTPAQTAPAMLGLEAARAAYLRGDCKAALPALETALSENAQDGLLHYQLGYCLQRAGELERSRHHKRLARPLLEKRANAGGSWDTFYYLAALHGLDFEDADQARHYAEEGLARMPDEQELGGVGCFQASRMARFAGQPEEEARWMRRAAERFAVQISPPPVYAREALLSAGQEAFSAGDNEQARDWLERAAELSPETQAAWFLGGVARLRLGDRAGAVRSFERLQHDPERTEAQYAIRLVRKTASASLPKTLPDGRSISDLEPGDRVSALGRACRGEWDQQSEGVAYALLMDLLESGQPLRETALRSGCVKLLFR